MCSSKFMNLSNVESDLRKAIETKSLDNVFQRYCKIWTPFMNCLNETILVLKECLDEDEKYQVDVALDIFDYMQVTLCSHGAIKFRQFYKEGGLDCVQEEWENIKKCIDEQKSIPKMLRQGNCQDFGEIRVCISEKLKFSNNSGPTEAINDMMQLLDEKFCNNASVSTPAPATGHQSLVTPVLLIAVFYLTLLITYF
nr:27 kDa glycoprotein-like [Leptinotarsa decemlineata]